MKLFLGIPTSGSPAAPFLESLGRIEIPAAVTSVQRMVVSGNFVPAQREVLMRRALDARADLLLMCDDDMILEPSSLDELLSVLTDDPGCALAGALYYSRDGFRPMAVDHWNPHDTTVASIPAFADAPVSVGGVGFGCVLIRLDAVHSLRPPYFGAHVLIESNAARVRVCDEDYLFCARLREHGQRVVLHAGVRCGHYDRASGRTFPEQWEDAAQTNRARMAVLQNGERKLVPLTAANAIGERHENVTIEYLWVDG